MTMMRRGDQGAASQLTACADLLRRGWDVYQAVSPASPCALVIGSGGRFLRVMVRTGRVSGTGACLVTVPRGRFDVLAVVVGGRVGYLPGLDGEPFPWPVTDALRTRVTACAQAVQSGQ